MATYFSDFSPYAAGALPSDWTERWAQPSGAGGWQVVAAAGTDGASNALQLVPPTGGSLTSATNAVSWNAIDADTGRDNAEVVFRWQNSVQGPTGANDGRAVLRGSGALAAENGYVIGNVNISNRLAKWVAGTRTDLQNVTQAPAAGVWMWTRARVNAGSLYNRTWQDGQPEPTTWAQGPFADTSIAGVGWVGLFQMTINGRFTVDCIGVGTAGATAPTSAPAVTVSAGADVTTQPNVPVPLTGTATSTSGGTITTRRWDQISGPSLGTNPLSTTATVTTTPTAAGRYVLRFTATDSLGGSGTDDVTIFVQTTTEARPIGVDTAGTWTPVGATTIDAALADESATTYAQSVDNPSNSAFVVDLAPSPAGNKTLDYTLQNSASTPPATYLVELLQEPAGTVVASWGETVSGTAVVTQSRTLTAAQNAAIVDPNTLSVRITGTV